MIDDEFLQKLHHVLLEGAPGQSASRAGPTEGSNTKEGLPRCLARIPPSVHRGRGGRCQWG
ncbi:hypothetical protein BD309DRAFT_967647 [Dichomitus squalens]|nr:hypothetical protein BD309DRAFT_967647 [Dichomitus squalens]